MPYTVNRGNLSTATDRDNISRANRDATDRTQDFEATDRAANNTNNRSVDLATRLSNVSELSRSNDFNRQNQIAREDRDFKREQSKLDRESKQGTGLIPNQQSMQKERDMLGREDIKSVNERNFALTRDAATAGQQKDLAMSLANTNNAAQQGLANTVQQTAFGEQSASVKRAQENARAQVSAALFGSNRQYTGY